MMIIFVMGIIFVMTSLIFNKESTNTQNNIITNSVQENFPTKHKFLNSTELPWDFYFYEIC